MKERKTVEGLFGIKATVIAYSSHKGIRLVTFEIEYPRMVLAELNTHRMLSRNSASSRAIPFMKMLEQLTARPVRFGQANPGMQDKGEDWDYPIDLHPFDPEAELISAEAAWWSAKDAAVKHAQGFFISDYHKQVYNRLLEPFQMMKTIVSCTEINNFYWLRDDDAADPTIRELARVMREAHSAAVPMPLEPGEWHLPYVNVTRDISGRIIYYIDGEFTDQPLTEQDAIVVSAARCAAVSFRNVDYGLEKCKQVHSRLIGDERKHASALEHQASPMYVPDQYGGTKPVNLPTFPWTWQEGVSHMDRKRQLWSGNLRGWIQYRKLVAGENMEG